MLAQAQQELNAQRAEARPGAKRSAADAKGGARADVAAEAEEAEGRSPKAAHMTTPSAEASVAVTHAAAPAAPDAVTATVAPDAATATVAPKTDDLKRKVEEARARARKAAEKVAGHANK